MSEVEPRYIKYGYWVNHAHGPVMGQTITTDTNSGTIIIALLAILSSLGLGHLFNLFTFLIYQRREHGSHEHRDGLFRQQQALLRTLPTPGSLLIAVTKLWLAWRRRAKRPLRRSIVLLVFALISVIGIPLAGVFSSSVITNINLEVLVDSPFCANIDQTTNETFLKGVYEGIVDSLALSYSNDCYKDSPLSSTRCGVFVTPKIKFNTTNTTCPFSEPACDSPAITFDSGLVDLNSAFGLNLAEKDQVHYRRKVTCALLSSAGRVKHLTASEVPSYVRLNPPFPDEEFLIYAMGYRPGTGELYNVTFLQSLTESNTSFRFDMKEVRHYSSPGIRNVFTPLPGMMHDDADILLRLINKNSVYYATPVNDPLFSAHKSFTYLDVGAAINITNYKSDVLSTPIGCTEQYQYCIHTDSSVKVCSRPAGLPANTSEMEFPDATKLQLSILNLLLKIGRAYNTVSTRKLKATDLLDTTGGEINSLPDDQWIIELTGWQSYTWAAHQIAIADYALGPKWRNSDADKYTIPPNSPAEQELCKVQKMQKTGDAVNINVPALIIIITLSGAIALIDSISLRVLIFLGRLQWLLSPRVDKWVQDGVFQWQRRVYQQFDEGVWTCLQEEIPITEEDTALSSLALTIDSDPPYDYSITQRNSHNHPDCEHRSRASSKQSPKSPKTLLGDCTTYQGSTNIENEASSS